MWLLFLGIFLFVLLIVVHEYGHFLVAKRNGVEVEEFGIGFPPKIYGRKLGRGIFEGYYTINLLPLGGFVRLKGENDADTRKGAFGAASTKAKLRIMLAGVAMNLVAALIFFTAVAWVGMPQVIPDQFTVESDTKITRQDVFAGFVAENSPAAYAGIATGDVITSIANQPVKTEEDLRTLTSSNAGNTVEVTYLSGGEAKLAEITLLSQTEVEQSQGTDEPKGYLGVVPREYILAQSTWSAPVVAVGLSSQVTWLTLKAVGGALANLAKALFNLVTFDTGGAKTDAAKAGENVAGPLGIFAILQQGADLGFQFILFVVAILSLTLAIMNFLPIPALDGGRAFVMLLFKGLKRPLTPELEDKIHGIGFITLMFLFLVIAIVDYNRFF
jgi:regulator of sigma E protease